MEKLACIVVLYNPNTEIIKRVINYTDYFGKVILVDNSTKKLEQQFCNDKIEYLSQNGNTGIAHALNIGLEKAKDLKFLWAITLDQDSIITSECVQQLEKTIKSVDDNEVAIISANYEPDKNSPEKGLESIHFAITSGSVMNLKIFEKAGNFIDGMFMDAVDYEYCYRLVTKGYKLLRDNRALFKHIVGNPTYVKGVKCRNYPAFRYYFITRNNLIVSKMYSKILSESAGLRQAAKKYKKSTRYEKNHIKKIIFIFIAKIDYILWLLTGEFYCHIKVPGRKPIKKGK